MGANQSTPQEDASQPQNRPRVESIFSPPTKDYDIFCYSQENQKTTMVQALNSEIDQITPIVTPTPDLDENSNKPGISFVF